MYRLPSRKKSKQNATQLNLIPILDAVFIFIFFLLVSSNYVKIFEIPSDVPIVSHEDPPENKKKPLALTLKITSTGIHIYSGIPTKLTKKIKIFESGNQNLGALHEYLITVKQKHVNERSVILEPIVDIDYNEIITIMDTIRDLKNTDPTIYRKDKDNIPIRETKLFSDIVFGNIQS